jgi:hypothetical protein
LVSRFCKFLFPNSKNYQDRYGVCSESNNQTFSGSFGAGFSCWFPIGTVIAKSETHILLFESMGNRVAIVMVLTLQSERGEG